MKNNLIPHYVSKPSDDIDIMKSAMVKVYCFHDYIEAVGVSYNRHFRTIKEIEAEKKYIMENFADLNVELRKGVTAGQRLTQLDGEIIKRRENLKVRKRVTRKSKTKGDNLTSLKRSHKKLVRLLKSNFSSPVFALCATMTYREKQYSVKNVYRDFSRVAKKLKYRFPNLRYIAIYEPHKDGSWHIHLVYTEARGLTRELLESMWEKGFVYIERFDADASAYFCKYDRLKYFPSYSRTYSASRNIKEPVEKELSPNVFKEMVEKAGMKCISAEARTLYKVDMDGEKRVNHFVYLNFKK